MVVLLPNHLWSWEYTVFAAEAHLNCAALAQEARRQGTPPAEFFDMRKRLGDEAASAAIEAWANAPVPKFYRL